MPWCHECGAEFREGFYECPICHTHLRISPPPEHREPEIQPDANVEPAFVTVVYTTREKEQAQAILDDAGIPTIWREWGSGQMVRIVTGFVDSIAGAALFVSSRDLLRVQALMPLWRSAQAPDGQAPDTDAAYDAYMAENARTEEELSTPPDGSSYKTLLGLMGAMGIFILLLLLGRLLR